MTNQSINQQKGNSANPEPRYEEKKRVNEENMKEGQQHTHQGPTKHQQVPNKENTKDNHLNK